MSTAQTMIKKLYDENPDKTYQWIADELNKAKFKTISGSDAPWNQSMVSKVLIRDFNIRKKWPSPQRALRVDEQASGLVVALTAKQKEECKAITSMILDSNLPAEIKRKALDVFVY